MTRAYFITGTSTDVGKTIVTAAIAAAAARRGFKTATLKPIQTGADGTAISDSQVIAEFCRRANADVDVIQEILSFKFPASPDLAARLQDDPIDKNLLLDYIRLYMGRKDLDILLIEGAGGLLVPVAGQWTVADMIRDLNIPAILVCNSALGSVNHALLSVAALRARRISIAGIVFNMVPDPPGIIDADNMEVIPRLSKLCTLAKLQRFDQPLSDAAVESLVAAATPAVAGILQMRHLL